MVFTTQIFLFFFFPICLFTYTIIDKLYRLKRISSFLLKIRAKELVIIFFSLGFYMWACFDNVFRFLIYILIVYLLGLWIENIKSKKFYININQKGGVRITPKYSRSRYTYISRPLSYQLF